MEDFEQWKEYFIANRQEALITFLKPLAGSHEAAKSLVEQCRDTQSDRRPLRIMNAIERLGRLSEEIAGRPLEGTALSCTIPCCLYRNDLLLGRIRSCKKSRDSH